MRGYGNLIYIRSVAKKQENYFKFASVATCTHNLGSFTSHFFYSQLMSNCEEKYCLISSYFFFYLLFSFLCSYSMLIIQSKFLSVFGSLKEELYFKCDWLYAFIG